MFLVGKKTKTKKTIYYGVYILSYVKIAIFWGPQDAGPPRGCGYCGDCSYATDCFVV